MFVHRSRTAHKTAMGLALITLTVFWSNTASSRQDPFPEIPSCNSKAPKAAALCGTATPCPDLAKSGVSGCNKAIMVEQQGNFTPCGDAGSGSASQYCGPVSDFVCTKSFKCKWQINPQSGLEECVKSNDYPVNPDGTQVISYSTSGQLMTCVE